MSLLGYAENHGVEATLLSVGLGTYDPETGLSTDGESSRSVQVIPAGMSADELGGEIDHKHRRYLIPAEQDDAFLWLPGSLNNNASTPHASALVPSSGFKIQARISPDSYAPSTAKTILYKGSDELGLTLTSNRIMLSWKHAGGTVSFTSGQLGLTAPTKFWVAGELANGEITFSKSGDGITFDTIGSAQDASAYPIAGGTGVLYVGVQTNLYYPYSGRIYRVRLYVDETLVFDPQFSTETPRTTSFTESSDEAATVTVNSSGSPGAAIRSTRPTTEDQLQIGSERWEIQRVQPYLKHGADLFHLLDVVRLN
jgi:hypothetical protein